MRSTVSWLVWTVDTLGEHRDKVRTSRVPSSFHWRRLQDAVEGGRVKARVTTSKLEEGHLMKPTPDSEPWNTPRGPGWVGEKHSFPSNALLA